jgi:hypothetical protein
MWPRCRLSPVPHSASRHRAPSRSRIWSQDRRNTLRSRKCGVRVGEFDCAVLFVPKADSECRPVSLGAVWAGQCAGWCQLGRTGARGFDAFLMPRPEVSSRRPGVARPARATGATDAGTTGRPCQACPVARAGSPRGGRRDDTGRAHPPGRPLTAVAAIPETCPPGEGR